MDEETSITQTIAGDSQAFTPLVERYHVGLIIYCEQYTHDRATAEDLAQDSFIKAYQNIRKYDPLKAKFSTWLYLIARSQCLDYIRTHKLTVDIDTLPDITAMTEHISEAQRSEIRTAVTHLEPPIYRDVIEDYYWHGLSYETIASKHNLPINTVRTHLRRAKSKLKGVLA